jgi:hypothetical protein|tara:strand:+ start:478 stop:597 length:120 start_codon:yes stop_codon:yes gene_type:complete
MERHLAAILAADVVGYSRVKGMSPEMRVITCLKVHSPLV